MTFHKVPKFPAELKSANPKRNAVINRHGRILLRKETLRRMGYDSDDEGDYRVCERHQFDEVVKRIQVKYKDEKPFSEPFLLTVPNGGGPNSSLLPSTSSKGTGTDRQVVRIMAEMVDAAEASQVPPGFSVQHLKDELASAKPTSTKEKLRHTEEQLLVTKVELEQCKADLAGEKLGRCQDWEHNSNEAHIAINPVLKSVAGLDVHQEAPSRSPNSQCSRFFNSTRHKPKDEKQRRDFSRDTPKVDLGMPDNEVKRRTGFPTMHHLLAYVFIVCNGDFDTIVERRSVLTWFEAWFMHFEFKWGRTMPRMQDVVATYGPDKQYLRKEIDLKYSIERNARDDWPTYVSYAEDISLREVQSGVPSMMG